jgi:hypothetical protein
VVDTLQKAPKEMRILVEDVLIIKGQVTVKVLLEVKVLVEEVLLFSLSSTPTQATHPRTRPAARVWAWGAKGLGCLIVPPAC